MIQFWVFILRFGFVHITGRLRVALWLLPLTPRPRCHHRNLISVGKKILKLMPGGVGRKQNFKISSFCVAVEKFIHFSKNFTTFCVGDDKFSSVILPCPVCGTNTSRPLKTNKKKVGFWKIIREGNVLVGRKRKIWFSIAEDFQIYYLSLSNFYKLVRLNPVTICFFLFTELFERKFELFLSPCIGNGFPLIFNGGYVV